VALKNIVHIAVIVLSCLLDVDDCSRYTDTFDMDGTRRSQSDIGDAVVVKARPMLSNRNYSSQHTSAGLHSVNQVNATGDCKKIEALDCHLPVEKC
jgi:hypothetical protein